MAARTPQTERANAVRMVAADDFARSIVNMLNDIEKINNYKFESLHSRCVALNYMEIPTRRGGEWTKTQISRVLKRVAKLDV